MSDTTLFVTFRLSSKSPVPAMRTRNDSPKGEHGVQMIEATNATHSLRTLDESFKADGFVLVDAWKQVREDDKKRKYLLVTFMWVKGENQPQSAHQAFFDLLTQYNFWNVAVYGNKTSLAVSAWGRTPTHNDQGEPIQVWYRNADGEKDEVAGRHEMAADFNLTYGDGLFFQTEN